MTARSVCKIFFNFFRSAAASSVLASDLWTQPSASRTATGASVLFTAAMFGMPVSTTHAITTSIMGVGCAKGFNALKLSVVERILWAWVLTLPASAAVAYALVKVARAAGWL